MCEPTHSIVQFNLRQLLVDSNGELQESSNLTAANFALGSGLKDAFAWGSKSRDFLHLSRMGAGHSESIKMTISSKMLTPDNAKYEANWWDRTVHLDSAPYQGWIPRTTNPFDQQYSKTEGPLAKLESTIIQQSIESATEYAKKVSTGNLACLRRFLEESFRKTERPVLYLNMVKSHLLSDKGRSVYNAKFEAWKKQFPASKQKKLSLPTGTHDGMVALGGKPWLDGTARLNSILKGDPRTASLTDLVVGLTRKRENLSDAWADDKELWGNDDRENKEANTLLLV